MPKDTGLQPSCLPNSNKIAWSNFLQQNKYFFSIIFFFFKQSRSPAALLQEPGSSRAARKQGFESNRSEVPQYQEFRKHPASRRTSIPPAAPQSTFPRGLRALFLFHRLLRDIRRAASKPCTLGNLHPGPSITACRRELAAKSTEVLPR